MAIDPVKIPTDIQIEEKIIGPVGLRQIFILMITGGFSYALWSSIGSQPTASTVVKIICWLPLILGAAFSFVKIHDVTLLRLLLLQIEKLQKPAIRAFGPREGIIINIQIDPTNQEKRRVVKKEAPEEQMEELSTVLDTGFDKLGHTSNEPTAVPQATPPPAMEAKKLPVQKERISASPIEENAPGMADVVPPTPEKEGHLSGGIFRDITPLA
jgi:hypothetical protein